MAGKLVTTTRKGPPVDMHVRLRGWIKRQFVIRPERQVWASDLVAGPVPRGALTRFGNSDPQHEHGNTSAGVCGPGGCQGAPCFTQRPYVPQEGREGSC